MHVKLGELINDSRELAVRPEFALTLIETSKPSYLAQDTVQIRLFTYDRWLKPATEAFTEVWVENSRGIRVAQWQNVNSNAGILSFNLPVASDTLFGIWKVKAITKKKAFAVKAFEVNALG